MIHRLYIMLFVLMFLVTKVSAQSFLWDVDFYGFFDNREYKYDKQKSQTLFATRLSPEIGVAVSGPKQASHRLMAGVSWIQPIGGKAEEGRVDPTVYYRCVMPRFQMSFGLFPRTQLIEPLPSYMQYDSLTYYNPNITGALFQYSGSRGYIEMYIDWRQVQTKKRREAFNIVASGKWQPGVFFLGGHIMMNHLARTIAAGDDQSVMDDMIVNPYIGVDFARYTPLSILSVKCGYLLSMERHRGLGVWHRPQGFLCDIQGEWRWLGLHNTLYTGESQMPFYEQFGSQLNQGDPFFQSNFYNRTDIYAYIFHNSFVNCKASFNLHFTPGKISYQQQLSVRFYLDSERWKNRKNPVNKSIKLKDIL